MLILGFDVFGVRIQYWMLVALVMAAAAIIFEMWSR